MTIAKECTVSAARLYELEAKDDDDDDKRHGHVSSMMIVVAAFVPVSAFLSFVAGSKFAKSRAEHKATREVESLMMVDTVEE